MKTHDTTFYTILAVTKQRLMSRPPHERVLNINCWNEWTEGSNLEPDKVHGMKYLEAVKDGIWKQNSVNQ